MMDSLIITTIALWITRIVSKPIHAWISPEKYVKKAKPEPPKNGTLRVAKYKDGFYKIEIFRNGRWILPTLSDEDSNKDIENKFEDKETPLKYVAIYNKKKQEEQNANTREYVVTPSSNKQKSFAEMTEEEREQELKDISLDN